MNTLFEADAPRPLADRLRPQTLSDVVGQNHILGPEGPLSRMIAAKKLASVIFWGPPGTGKTSAAKAIAAHASVALIYVPLEAVASKYYGESERLLSQVFQLCDRLEGAVVFLDEVDALACVQSDPSPTPLGGLACTLSILPHVAVYRWRLPHAMARHCLGRRPAPSCSARGGSRFSPSEATGNH